MKNSKWSFLLLALFFVVSAITLSSCKDDDDDNETASEIVGTWTCADHYYGGSDTFVFKSNGSYTWSYNGTADWFSDKKGKYAFNGVSLILSDNDGTTTVYIVSALIGNNLFLVDEDGEKYLYQRK